MPPLPDLEPELAQLAARDRLRSLSPLTGKSRHHSLHADQPVLAFCSNDYLGLADHPAVTGAAARAAELFGAGAGASRLISGSMPAHGELETALAALVRLPAALLFSTGYQANLGAIASLAGPEDLIASDQANHASIIDGCRLARARIAIYRHADADAALAALRTSGSFRRRFLITESLFSMDGDRAPLGALAAHARSQAATLIVDEAHALGVLGPRGRGLCQQAGIVPDVLVGTLGKAFGSFGGFIAGSVVLREYLVNRARTFIYTTAPPPPSVAAALAGVHLALSPEGDRRREQLTSNLARLHIALAALSRPLVPSETQAFDDGPNPIVPIPLGSDKRAVEVGAALLARGVFARAIRPPTVPEGTARLRVTLSAGHSPADVDHLSSALQAILA